MDRIKSVKLTTSQWDKITRVLHEEYPKSLFMIRDRMKTKLGFTTRNHMEFYIDTGYTSIVYLDFYSEHKRTMFLLKYSEFINKEMNGELI